MNVAANHEPTEVLTWESPRQMETVSDMQRNLPSLDNAKAKPSSD